MPKTFHLLPIALLVATAVAVAACGSDDEGAGSSSNAAAGGERPRVVATTTQVADLVRSVAGNGIELTQLLTANADPHGYELRPRDVEAIADADLVVRSGGDLDDWLTDAIEESGADAQVVTLIDSVKTIEGGHGHEDEHAAEEEHEDDEEIDPHWWQDPRNAATAVTEIEHALATVDPANATRFADAAKAYSTEIDALDRAVAGCWDEVPAQQRKLVTTHDALGYYAERYGLEVVGTVIPSLSTQGQPSAGELAELAETIRHEGVKVVFAESSVNSKVEQAMADEAGATVGKALWADTLGPEGSDGASYLESIAANTRAMVDGVTAGAVSCTLPVR